CRQLVAVGVPVRLAAGEDALVVPRSGGVCQLPLGLDPYPPATVAKPRLRRQRPLGRTQLEHLAASAQGLANRAPHVDVLGDHRLGTSRKPGSPAMSRTSQPAASISSRSRSAEPKSPPAR